MSKVKITGIEIMCPIDKGRIGVILHSEGDLREDIEKALASGSVFLTNDERLKKAQELIDSLIGD